jgi:hypothetical protein
VFGFFHQKKKDSILQSGDNSASEILKGSISTNINSVGLLLKSVISSTRSIFQFLFPLQYTYRTIGKSGIDSRRDSVGFFFQVQVSQHHDGGQDHGSGVGRVLVLDIKTNMATSLLYNVSFNNLF